MLITEQKRKKRLGNCPIGLFMFEGELCVKTEFEVFLVVEVDFDDDENTCDWCGKPCEKRFCSESCASKWVAE